MSIQAENYDPALKAGAVINSSNDIGLTQGSMLIGNSSGVAVELVAKTSGQILVGNGTTLVSVAVSGDATLSSAGAVAVTKINGATLGTATATSGNLLIGSGTAWVTNAVSGDITLSSTGVTAIGAGKVTNAMVADSTGVGALGIRKSATVLYDFALSGGTIGTITPTGSPTIPDKAVVWIESYDVITTFTSAGADAATFKLVLPTNGDLNTAIAISDATNPWDAGVKAAAVDMPLILTAKKTTAARVPQVVIADQNITAGKIVFQLAYWVSA